MKTTITIEVTHDKPLPHLANMVAGRAYTIQGVRDAVLVPTVERDLLDDGFTPRELALGNTEVVRG